jgi:hypothetical protein
MDWVFTIPLPPVYYPLAEIENGNDRGFQATVPEL